MLTERLIPTIDGSKNVCNWCQQMYDVKEAERLRKGNKYFCSKECACAYEESLYDDLRRIKNVE